MSISFTSGAITVTINRGIEHTSQFWKRRLNQFTQTSSDGSLITFDNSITVLEGIINIRFITSADATSLRDFITNTIRFSRNTLTITPESYDDLGEGDGVALTSVNYNGGISTDGIIEPFGKAGKFNVKFPYRKIITPSSSTADADGNAS